MLIRDISDYIRSHGRVPLRDLALHFRMDETAVADILERLKTKGRILELGSGSTCGSGCCKCDPATVRIFVWNDNQTI